MTLLAGLARRPRLAAALALAAAATSAAACESEARRAPAPAALAAELDKICHAVELAGAADLPEGDRMVQVAVWLDKNIRSEEGLTFLRAFAKLGNDKAARHRMLDEAARANGVRDCPLLAFWK